MTRPSPKGRHHLSHELGTWTAALAILEELNTPKSLAVAIQLRYAFRKGCKLVEKNALLQSALSTRFDPFDYSLYVTAYDLKALADRVSRDYQATKLLSKIDWNLGVDRQETALRRFLAAEERCRETNFRFSVSGLSRASQHPIHARFAEICFRAKSKIRRILGSFDLDRAIDLSGYGPGVTLEARNRPIHPAKVSTSVVFSPNSWRLLSHVIGFNPIFMEATTSVKPDGPCCMVGFSVRDDDELSFVPKTWKTDRTICIGSSASIYIQKGIGKLLRNKLKRAGVDLDDQSHNQRLAEQASLNGSLATVDLESASDTISAKLVEFLLPSDWFNALNAVRAVFTTLPSGERLFLNKFSAMGNGYTFELESLIFFALVSAYAEYKDNFDIVSVYGDDIIVSASLVPGLIEFLSYCGFTANKEKTYWTGNFRESCGKDFIYGFDVRPFFIKKEVVHLEDYFKLANQIRAWRIRRTSYSDDNTLCRIYGRIYHCVDKNFRYRIPPSYPGDAGFHSTESPGAAKSDSKGFFGWYFKFWGVKPQTLYNDSVAALCSKLMLLAPTDYLKPATVVTGNLFGRRDRGHSHRASRMGYTFDWS